MRMNKGLVEYENAFLFMYYRQLEAKWRRGAANSFC